MRLTVETAAAHLVDRGVIPDLHEARSRVLGGGVSGEVVLVEHRSRTFVVKQALATLRTEEPWHADPSRTLTEAAALIWCAAMTPDRVPRVVDIDEESFVVTMTAAPARWRDWKRAMLDDPLETTLERARTLHDPASELGRVLGRWHRTTSDQTAGSAAQLAAFTDRRAFKTLRVEPFHERVLDAHPDLVAPIRTCIDDLLEPRPSGGCLVHGDFSPKNIVFGDDGLWILDHEVAHAGAPVFDLAFMTSHLALKAVHRSELAESMHLAWRGFLTSYLSERPAREATRRLAWHAACLMLARVEGTSPVDYLRPPAQDRVRAVARQVLTTDGDQDPETLWDLLLRSTP